MIKNQHIIDTIFNFMSIKGVGPVQTNRLLLAMNDYSPISIQNIAFNLLNVQQRVEFEEIKDQPIDINSKFAVEFILLQEEAYPEEVKKALGSSAPPVLSVIGNKDLLIKKKVAFSGSRNVSDKGIKITEDTVTALIAEDVVIVSGYAKGVDFAAHYTALKNGGSTIIVLPEGINHFRIKKEFREVWDWERVLVISEFQPFEKWMASRAMKRNATIIGLSDVVMVIEAGATGGSLDAGHKTLDMNKALFVPQYTDIPDSALGNTTLLSRGAFALKMSKETKRPNISKILELIETENKYSLF
ncbi:DNA-processing protein DprA [Sphingobacterium sp. UT-1RO-CII-1]|uniref:DNA-processing protein DprA n=1 Tax=Sphingobacterium sp. UT-1RO-CII-1 TaxID=2995225 RepID=UPI00227B21C8|nr:DNA-processing protein DprA [Sphingobacterium sp. UT-1RO-CII-1]MCY4779086.1 DNA-processing protein DprA [Sphingobacterium sp. UT-1RO-CII-1]